MGALHIRLLASSLYLVFAPLAGFAQQKTAAAPAATPTAVNVTTTGGTRGLLSAFDSPSSVVNSQLYTNLTYGGLGIGRAPAASLDVLGQTIFRGGAVFSRSGDATTSAGKPSFPFQFQTSVYNSNNKGTLIPNFTLQTEPTGNNTASTGATLNFLYYSGVGSAPGETGLYFNPNGVIHFAPAQTFPISQGPQGPAGPAGPQGNAGPSGPTGPQGPALSFPYSGAATVTSGYMFGITNQSGAAGYFQAGESSNGLTAVGGKSGTGFQSAGGTGIFAYGGAVAATALYAGIGGYFMGGSSPSGGPVAADGIDAVGGAGADAGRGGYGIYARAGDNGTVAAFLGGDVTITGNVSKAGGSFRIDHPDDPANKYLSHSFVESPDMMNIYNGNVVTDGSGTAVVTMPTYFESLNRDFRYQLTVMGHQFAQALVDSEIANGSFTIKTDRPNIKVSWQVTGVRQDAWANAHRIPVEEDKSAADKGRYLHPELFGRPYDANIEESHRPSLPRQNGVAPVEISKE